MMYLIFFAALFLLLYGLLLIPMEKRSRVKKRVQVLLDERDKPAPFSPEEKDKKESFQKRVLLPLWMRAKKGLAKRMPGKQMDKLDKLLMQAGNPFGMTGTDFRISQFVFLIAMPVLSVGYGMLLEFPSNQLVLFFVVGLGIGLLIPRYYLTAKIKQRKKQATLELPDFVDLLLVSLEAGLGFDLALSKVIGKQDGVLAKEFRRCLEELRLGRSRREALTGLRDRLEVDELSTFINNVLRAEKLGVGMVQVLRILTVDMRDQRRQKAEETAMKAPIKILFPLVLFIFPSLFIVILGPVAIQLYNDFMK
ncbi:type II secretion system F family protein [Neobacillus vireti]|uniref:type II secretion system F family protein n=1 Tax=Neobacillus vireti TaxID=220686 RepID=UPI002FFF992F